MAGAVEPVSGNLFSSILKPQFLARAASKTPEVQIPTWPPGSFREATFGWLCVLLGM